MRKPALGRILSAAVTLCALSAYSAFAGEVATVEDAWVAAAPPGVKAHAGYLTLHNLSAAPIDLVEVASPQYEHAEVHHTTIEGGVAKMVRQAQVSIPAGGVLKMSPGGFHLMLMHPVAPLQAGDAVELRLGFADGSTVTFRAPVRKAGSPVSHDHHHHHKTH